MNLRFYLEMREKGEPKTYLRYPRNSGASPQSFRKRGSVGAFADD